MSANKKSNFIPSPFTAVTEYENQFVKDFNSSIKNTVKEVLKELAKITVHNTKTEK